MTAMKFQLVLCFLLGLYAFASATSQYAVRFVPKSTTSGYPHAGRPEVYINGAWGTICAGSGWDMNDAEVVCRDLGKGYVNTITVSGGVNQAGTSVRKCLSQVNCYGHENRLRECDVTVSDRPSNRDVGIVCFPPPSDAGLRLTYGPDQYSGRVELKLADGSWRKLALYPYNDLTRYQYIPNICRQLGFGELNWWDALELSTATAMTNVHDCAYGVAHHRGCSSNSGPSEKYQAFVGCHKPGSIPCSAPYVPNHATIDDLRVNYNFGDRVSVACDTSDARFTLQCHSKGLWSGPVVSCPEPSLDLDDRYCNAPSVPPDSTIQNRRLTYDDGDYLNVTCNHAPDWFELSCDDGIWNGQNIMCPAPIIENMTCSTPYIPQHATVNDLRLNYNFGDTVNIICDASNIKFTLQCHNKGLWSGPDVSCPKPDQPSHSYCNAPAVPPDSTIQNRRLKYEDGNVVNVTCNHGPDWFQLSCDDGIWNGQNIVCPEPLIENVTCSTPYIPQHATVNDLRLNYNFGDTVNIICDASNYRFTLQCDTKGLWSGPDVSCPKPDYPSHSYCNAPAVPPDSTIQNRRLTYTDGDILNVNCNHSPDWFQLSCDDGIWNGQNVACPEPLIDAHSEACHAYCNAPSLPPDSSIQNRRLTYKDGDILNVTCNQGPYWYELRCDDGIWNGQNIVCPDPVIACNPPFIPAISSIEEIKARYKVGEDVNITCNDGSDWFIWECQSDGMWGGRKVRCSLPERLPPVYPLPRPIRTPSNDKNSWIKLFVNGLLVTAVMLFIVVIMSMAVFVFYVRTHGFAFPRSTETALQDAKENRGPLPDLPDGYTDYIGGEQGLYTDPYLKHGTDDYQSYETFQRPL